MGTERGALGAAERGAAEPAAGADACTPADGAALAGVAAAIAEGAGILMVGEAVGFGGRLMRTVSFLGCTLAASAGFGGTGPVGVLGIFSAIII